MFAALAIPSIFSGCCSWHVGRRADFAIRRSERREIAVYTSWAANVLEGESVSDGYRDGFVTGFVDHVYAGGVGRPPLIPPAPYWGVSRAPVRREWRMGFREGTDVAIQGGFAERALMRGACGSCAMSPDSPVVDQEFYEFAADPEPPSESSTSPSWRNEPEPADPELPPMAPEPIPDDFSFGGRTPLDPELIVDEDVPPAPSMELTPVVQEPEWPEEPEDWSLDPFDDDWLGPPAGSIEIVEPRSESASDMDELDDHEFDDRDMEIDDDLLLPSTSMRETFPGPPVATVTGRGRRESNARWQNGFSNGGDRTYADLIRASETEEGRSFVDSMAIQQDSLRHQFQTQGKSRPVAYHQALPSRPPPLRPAGRSRTTEDVMRRMNTMFRDLDHLDHYDD